jgi:hypothetical protein
MSPLLLLLLLMCYLMSITVTQASNTDAIDANNETTTTFEYTGIATALRCATHCVLSCYVRFACSCSSNASSITIVAAMIAHCMQSVML